MRYLDEKDMSVIAATHFKRFKRTLPRGSLSDHVLAAQEFFITPSLGFIQNVLGRVRTMSLGSISSLWRLLSPLSIYPFYPAAFRRHVPCALCNYWQQRVLDLCPKMRHDVALSYITKTQPGELGGKFWRQLVTFGAGPLLPLLAEFVSSWAAEFLK
jgi:hypothetical protein